MKIKSLTALCLLTFQAAAYAGPGADPANSSQMDALLARVNALQAEVDAMRANGANASNISKSANTGSAQVTAGPPQDAATDGEGSMREQVTNMALKVDSLEEAASTGPLANLSVTGYLDPVYLYNRAQHSGGFMFVNHDPGVYNYYNSTIGDVYLDIKKSFGVGPLAPTAEIVIQPNRGTGGSLLTNENGGFGNNIFTQADVTVPLNSVNTFEAGLMPALAGYEAQSSNQMLMLTHNLLYDFSAPGDIIGIGLKGSNAIYTHLWQVILGNEQVHTAASIVNAPNNTTKSNLAPTLMGRFDDVLSTALDIGISGTIGRQTLFSPCATAGGYGYQCNASSPFGMDRYIETDLTYTKDKYQLNAELDYGQLQKGAWNGGTAKWYGISLLGYRKWTSAWFGHMGASLRADYLNDTANGGGGSDILYGTSAATPAGDGGNGFGIDPACLQASTSNGSACKGAAHYDITTDLLFYPTPQITVKLEYRHDQANHAVFLYSNGSYSRSNDIAATQFIYAF